MYRYTVGGKRLEYRMQVFTRHISLSLKSAHGHCNDVARIIFILRAVLFTVMGIKHTLFLKWFLLLRQRRVEEKKCRSLIELRIAFATLPLVQGEKYFRLKFNRNFLN
jgi:hypothetical protein